MGAFTRMGSVVLCVTGAEALFADMGHFGRRPIYLSWFAVVYPSLLLAYTGQAAYLAEHLGDESLHGKSLFWEVCVQEGI